MTGPRAQRFTMERRCVGCEMSRSVRSFNHGGALCKQCRDNGPPVRVAPAPVAVDEALEAFIRGVREAAGVPGGAR